MTRGLEIQVNRKILKEVKKKGDNRFHVDGKRILISKLSGAYQLSLEGTVDEDVEPRDLLKKSFCSHLEKTDISGYNGFRILELSRTNRSQAILEPDDWIKSEQTYVVIFQLCEYVFHSAKRKNR